MIFCRLRKGYFSSKRVNEGGSENLFWHLMALFWEQFFSRFPPHRELLREIVEHVGEPNSSSGLLLDAGCGPGLLSLELARRGHKVLGIDRSREMLKRAQKKKEIENLDNLSFLEMDLNKELGDQKYLFHKIFFVHSLYLLKDPRRTLEKAASALSEGDEILMCNPWRRYTPAEFCAGGLAFLKEALREKGFLSFFSFLAIALAVGTLHLVIQYRKKRIYHCWNEKEIEELLKISGFRLKWLQKSCLKDSHLLLYAVKER